MEAAILHAVITEDHTLNLQVPPEVPVGPADVIVVSRAPNAGPIVLTQAQRRAIDMALTTTPSRSKPGSPTTLDDLRDDRAR